MRDRRLARVSSPSSPGSSSSWSCIDGAAPPPLTCFLPPPPLFFGFLRCMVIHRPEPPSWYPYLAPKKAHQSRPFAHQKHTHKSFQNTLSNPSSPRSSSVTPPNMTPVPLADQSAIVHPARAVGVCVDDAVLRFSHFNARGVDRDGSRVILDRISAHVY